MNLIFHWISGSPFAWRVQLALEYKGLTYESRRKDPSKREHKSDDYLAINPRGKVPALQDGDFSIYESLAILTYLEGIQPTPALLGSSAQETARIWQRIYELDNYVAPPVMGIVRPVLFGAEKPDPDKIAESAADVHREFELLDKQLSESQYLSGDEFSAADLAFVPILQYLIRACEKQTISEDNFGFQPFASHYPNISAWSTRVEAMPCYQQAYPPHWRD